MPMLTLAGLDLELLATALADQSIGDCRWLIDPATGELIRWSEDLGIDGEHPVDLDDLDLLAIWPLPPRVWYRDMADFAAGLSDARAAERLEYSLHGKGAFRRFRDELHRRHPDLVPAWRAFSDARGHQHAVDWLIDNDLIDQAEADRFFADHRDPAIP
jgi:hypothetical protein